MESTGPAMTGPIFESWTALDYTDYGRTGYYGVPYYVRSAAAYYAGAPPSVRPDLTVGETLGAVLITSLMGSVHSR